MLEEIRSWGAAARMAFPAAVSAAKLFVNFVRKQVLRRFPFQVGSLRSGAGVELFKECWLLDSAPHFAGSPASGAAGLELLSLADDGLGEACGSPETCAGSKGVPHGMEMIYGSLAREETVNIV